MDPAELAKQYGLTGVLIGMLAWLLHKVGMRIVAALDRVVARVEKLGDKIDDHTKVDVESHAEMAERIAKIEGALRIDEPERARPTTPVYGVRVVRSRSQHDQ